MSSKVFVILIKVNNKNKLPNQQYLSPNHIILYYAKKILCVIVLIINRTTYCWFTVNKVIYKIERIFLQK